jgi:hypothetical protein
MTTEILPLTSINNLLSLEECRSYISLAEEQGFSESNPINDRRKNWECYINNMTILSQVVSRLRLMNPLAKIELGLPVEIFKSQKGHYVREHTDASRKLDSGVLSNKTLIIYLNESYSGGETFFHSLDSTITPKTGKAIFFDQNTLLHEGKEVTSGIKYIMRFVMHYLIPIS